MLLSDKFAKFPHDEQFVHKNQNRFIKIGIEEMWNMLGVVLFIVLFGLVVIALQQEGHF